jgi:hypothetical protein
MARLFVRGLVIAGCAAGLSIAAPRVAQAQADIVVTRDLPPPRPLRAGRLAGAAPTPRGLRSAGLDLFGDSSEAAGGTLRLKFGFVDQSSWLRARLTGAIAFDALQSAVDNGVRQTGVGDLWLRSSLRVWDAGVMVTPVYALKVPTASEDKGLGSGRADHRFVVGVDLRWPKEIWTNVSLMATLRGGRSDVFRGAGSIELPIGERDSWARAYQGYVHVQTPFADPDGSSYQEHGGALQVGSSPVGLEAGVSLHRDAGAWTSGGYLRLTVTPQ